MKKRRVLVLVHEDLVPPDELAGHDEKSIREWKTEYDVVSTLRNMGHEARPLGVSSDLGVIRSAIEEFKPHVCFNLLEEFHGIALYDQHVVSYLELLRQPYTGCNPRGLTLAHDKALSKKVLAYHRIPAPRFKVFPVGRKVRRPARLSYPLIVKSLTEDASLGISQASVVNSDEKLIERVHFIHEKIGTDAMADQYIEGRELYVGLMGNQRLVTLPIWELRFTNLPEGAEPIATEKVKWDEKYQEQLGIKTGPAKNLGDGMEERILKLCKRAYRALGLSGYARMDLRLQENGRAFVIEANPNPQLAFDEEFAESAAHVSLKYEDLLHKILNLGISYRARWREVES
ncbi:MAG: D-alanine--D-alanine ligase family protein [Planctomycetota bacterium]|jgi:D-alanine-D-alanine ligase